MDVLESDILAIGDLPPGWLDKPATYIDDPDELLDLVRVALGADRRASDDDALPDEDSDDRRGWWGDTDASLIWGGWPIGTRLWLMSRAKIAGIGAGNGAATARIETYVAEGLMPLVDNKIASKLDVAAVRTDQDRIDVLATISRGPLPAIALRYQPLWDGIASL